jgi:hypothetical protein
MNTKVFADLSNRFRFAERLRYNGVWIHDCWADHNYFQVEVGESNFENLRPLYNGTPVEFERDIVGRLNTITTDSMGAPSRELVVAFNRWRQDKHSERVARILNTPELYGVIDRNDPFLAPPAVVVPAHYEQGKGWIPHCTVEDAKAEAGL